MTGIERTGLVVTWTVALATATFLLTPLVVTTLVSFSPSTVFDLPTNEFSLRWYEALATKQGLVSAVRLSFEIAALSTAVSLVLGTLCAIAVVRGYFPGRNAINTFMVSPLMMPGLVIGVALLQAFREAGLRDAYTGLLLAHVVITLPFVMRTVTASLSLFDFTLVDAARMLGCSYPKALLKVMIPNLAPAYLTSGLFAFLASMDNYPISIFLTDARNKTLPIQMLQYLDETPDPTIAAISTGLILFAIVALVIADRLVGLRRIAEF